MRFDDRFIEELKSRLRPSEVIGRTVKLKRQGREWAGLSPFSKEKTPSFFVNDDKGFYHDFSSGKHGDVISFLQETQRLSFREAVERLAAEAGMQLPAEDPREAERAERRQGLQDWLDLAAKYFEANLRRPPGRAAREYLTRRGLPEDQWSRFRLGYASADRTGLKDALVQRGARPADLVEAGLLIEPEDGGAPYDRFRDRIIFPITDGRGRLISFGGRAMNPDARAKYLNGPETSLFHKGSHLYGLFDARRLLGGGGEAPLVVVEGYMDVIACQRAGIAAVAPMGTALTEDQMRLLWRLHPEPTLCFDGDGAGLRAAFRSIDRALPELKPGKSFRFALLGGGQDPDDLLRDKGAAALRAAVDQTVPLIDMLFRKEAEAEPLATPEQRAGFKQRLREAARRLQDADLAEQYRAALFERFDQAFPRASRPQGRGGWNAPAPKLGQTTEGKAAQAALTAALEPLPAAIVSYAIDHPEVLDDRLETLTRSGLGDERLDQLIAELVRLRLDAETLDSAMLRRHLAGSGHQVLMREVEKAAVKSGAPFLATDGPLAVAHGQWSLAFDALSRLAALEEAIESSKSDADGYRALPTLKAERDALKRAIGAGTIWDDGGS
ncbi:DNA primase [Brevundimonas sp. 2R-24]|uniref:DNA primase n=1 Tax=Peiella sedimenti TaxID=3061083 RepID=A0ABT8SPG3_9CAUL|nr:DNA primase [Caulobacteraceae bacterium XZ-24]